MPFQKRKLAYHSVFLNTTVPFHHPGFKQTPAAVMLDCKAIGLRMSADVFAFPVYSTTDGTPMAGDNILEQLATQIALEPVHWPKATAQADMSATRPISHILDFGPSAGVSTITARNKVCPWLCIPSTVPELCPHSSIQIIGSGDGLSLHMSIWQPLTHTLILCCFAVTFAVLGCRMELEPSLCAPARDGPRQAGHDPSLALTTS